MGSGEFSHGTQAPESVGPASVNEVTCKRGSLAHDGGQTRCRCVRMAGGLVTESDVAREWLDWIDRVTV